MIYLASYVLESHYMHMSFRHSKRDENNSTCSYMLIYTQLLVFEGHRYGRVGFST